MKLCREKNKIKLFFKSINIVQNNSIKYNREFEGKVCKFPEQVNLLIKLTYLIYLGYFDKYGILYASGILSKENALFARTKGLCVRSLNP